MFIVAPTDSVSIAPPWDRVPAEEIRRLGEVPAADVGDALGRMTVMDGGIRLLTGQAALLGTALTVDVRSGDNLAVHRALDDARPGDVLVVNGHGDGTRALVGDLIGEIMVNAGVVGAVVDGAIRDVRSLREMGLAVYARTVTPAGPFKDGPGAIGVPVAVGGVVVEAGDVLVGDADGVVVVPRRRVKEAVDAVGEVVGKQEALRRRILAARSGDAAGCGDVAGPRDVAGPGAAAGSGDAAGSGAAAAGR
ncbi:RraA family protein [Nonomuraea fuscirosea]|uniref:Putative 4-hydroxy-4-methyl-2-oxoglutarate aldolase n=1 Tax=Nonomuraea fuscirosea TaxID=1291556 RepID=A0A2T0MXW8_9ACTN|nr:methyltransferase [Nonomuraea fuscirosea]PRX64088.1 RraA family protein [Nonomuraea fuscirosea]